MSVALLRDETLWGEWFLDIEQNHGETLLPVVSSVLERTGVTIRDVDLFVVTLGPGSFTGLRVGASTAKGFALATGTPIVGVSTLETLALNLPNSPVAVCPMLDARKSEVYTALVRPKNDYRIETLIPERIASPAEFLTHIDEDVIFVGDGAIVYEDIIRESLPRYSRFAAHHLNMIRASSAGLLGLKKYRDGDTLDPVGFTPHYLRISEAEAKRRAEENT
jgi:tRNA threonylcarbamoyladenosine biosynthesis protein TsaB